MPTLVLAHLAGLLEPLLFAPAFVAVFAAIVKSRRQQQATRPEPPRSEEHEPH